MSKDLEVFFYLKYAEKAMEVFGSTWQWGDAYPPRIHLPHLVKLGMWGDPSEIAKGAHTAQLKRTD